MENLRKLASIRTISEILPIEGADAIELVIVDGWKVVVAKNVGHQVGNKVVYCEIDSFLPIEPEFEFLRKSSFKRMGVEEGFRLKTIRLRGQLSQGLILPLSDAIEVMKRRNGEVYSEMLEVGMDVSTLLGIQKYEPPLPAELSGKVKGLFPSQIPRTDEERIQNLKKEYEEYRASGKTFYVTEKLDGCLDGNTIIETETGHMTIRDICETNYSGKVKSYNVETDCVEYRKVKNVFINTPSSHQWYNIALENGTEIKLTGNHRVWLPELLCWRRVDDLNGDEVFLLKN